MTHPRHRLALIVGCLFLTSALQAQDWPQWRGPQRNGTAAGFLTPAQWPPALTEAWKVAVGAGDATPALVGDRVYLHTRQNEEEVTLCLNGADGKVLWRDAYPTPAPTGPARAHAGPRSSPAVAQGKVVTLGVNGVLSCLDAATGKLLWRKDPFPGKVPRFYTASSPLIVENLAVAHLGGPGEGGLMAFDLTTGELKWQWTGEGPDYGSPVLMRVGGTRLVVTLTEKSLVGVDLADGKLRWQIPSIPSGRAYNACTPVVEGEKLYVSGGQGLKAIAIQKQGDAFAARELWTNTDGTVQFNSPVLKNGYLYGLSARGNLFCVNGQTGQTAWVDPTPRGRGGFGSIVDAGAVLLVLPNAPQLIVLRPSEKGCEEVAKLP
ncbi:MAG: PQQ-like beta-propeller repeat protein, partial [Armatimonadota bacterium]|nr:PQQ-like beta-propeller repeat protein [Armatimonadota bacterium]